MPLRRSPFRPRYCAVVLLSGAPVHEAWVKYIAEAQAEQGLAR